MHSINILHDLFKLQQNITGKTKILFKIKYKTKKKKEERKLTHRQSCETKIYKIQYFSIDIMGGKDYRINF